MIGRIIIRPLVAVAALYVAVAMAAALARVSPHDMDAYVVAPPAAPATAADSELYELRTEDIVP